MKTSHPERPASPCLHGLLAWLEDTRIALPLKGVEANFTVRGDVASVQLDQIYHQDHDRVLDVTYAFPLPAGAAVHRCELHVNGRIISARVEEVEKARRIAAEKKAEGHRTALVETVRENLFELELGNLAPGDTVVIRLCWIASLERLGGGWSLRIPFCPGIRYVPGKPLLRRNLGRGTADDTDTVPDASRLSPPRMDALHPDAAYVSIEGTVDAATADASALASPSHTLVLRESEGLVKVLLGDRAAVPDRDFVLRGRDASAASLKQAAWICEDERGCHALVRAVAPAEMESSADAAQDVYFLVDRSGSMAGVKWMATCKALRTFLTNLAPQDRAWITWFESSWQDMAERPLPPAALLAEPAMKNLEQWGTAGGTELLPALTHVLEVIGQRSRNRRVVTVIITDGQVGNEAEILSMMRQHPSQRVFTFGIDTVVNDAFLRKLAVQQRGSCHLATPEEDLVTPIAALAMRLRRPVLTDLQPGAGWELPAGAPPDLLAGEALSMMLRRTDANSTLSFSGARADGERVTIAVTSENEALSGIGLLWAKRRIESLIDSGQNAEAIALAKDANLLCEGVAFIAWDEAERIAVKGGALPIYQPAMEPAQWDMAFEGGAVLMRNCLPCAPMAMPSPAPPPPRAKAKRRFLENFFGRKDTGWAPPPALSEEAFDLESAAPLIKESFADRKLFPILKELSLLSPVSVRRWNDELIAWIEQWLISEPAQLHAREKKVEALVASLNALPAADRVAFLEQWLAETFKEQPAFLRGCLAGIQG
ncbi:MAG TPA: VIT domain-containing protein [Verrucomicrobiales bacterium]|nr:VIT domain-containing protein [Verrucomicrobiales bacterium]